MSRATIELLVSTDFVVAVLIGGVALIALIVSRAVTRQPFPVGGVVLAVGVIASLVYAGQSAPLLIMGVAVLAAGGLVRTTSVALKLAVAIPGAALIGAQLLGGALTYLPAAAVVAIVVLSPLVASFDATLARSTMASPLLAVSLVSVFFVVPDTEVPLILAGAAALWLVSGPPAMVTRLGGAGAYATTGLLVWDVAVGGAARPASLVAGVATLGVLVAVPVVLVLGPGAKREAFASLSGGTLAQWVSTAAVQVAVGLLMTIVVRVDGGKLVVAFVMALGILAVAGIAIVSVWDPRQPTATRARRE